jgi:hypothetical protein
VRRMGVGWLCLVCGERLERFATHTPRLQKFSIIVNDFRSFPLL